MAVILTEFAPRASGSYALCLRLEQSKRLRVGRLGVFDFPAGDYVYSGSAHGPGGLRRRLERHLHPAGKLHWHIDALRAAAGVKAALFALEAVQDAAWMPLECAWSQLLARQLGARIPAAHFGNRDCRCGCPAHLVHFEAMPVVRLAEVLGQASAGVGYEIIMGKIILE